MKKFIPLFVVLAFLSAGAYWILNSNPQKSQESYKEENNEKTIKDDLKKESFHLNDFYKKRSCARIPLFLYKRGIKLPIIDLSQQHFKGIAFYYGYKFKEVLHLIEWERFDALGTYTIDNRGDIYLTPTPFITIKPTTFNLQKNIYRLDGKSGELDIWMRIDEVEPTPNNPYGLISIVYDCKSANLIVSSIDKSNYKKSQGRIYTIKRDSKEIIGKIEGFDALTISILHTKDSRFLVAGSARDNGVYLIKFNSNNLLEGEPIELFKLPDAELRVRKIKVIGKNRLKLEAIKFNYSLIVQTDKKQRDEFIATYDSKEGKWNVRRE